MIEPNQGSTISHSNGSNEKNLDIPDLLRCLFELRENEKPSLGPGDVKVLASFSITSSSHEKYAEHQKAYRCEPYIILIEIVNVSLTRQITFYHIS